MCPRCLKPAWPSSAAAAERRRRTSPRCATRSGRQSSSRPPPQHTDLLPAATEKLPCYLPVDAGHGAILTAGADLEDRLADALDGDAPMVALRIDTWEDIDALTDVQYLLTKPLCLVCDDAELLEAALRVYQGRALYEGALPEAALPPLSDRYGLLI